MIDPRDVMVDEYIHHPCPQVYYEFSRPHGDMLPCNPYFGPDEVFVPEQPTLISKLCEIEVILDYLEKQ